MKAILSAVLEVASRIVLAQEMGDPMADLRACSLMEHAERLECLEKLSRSIAPPAGPAPGNDNWIVSETTSPVNYTPIVTATALSMVLFRGEAAAGHSPQRRLSLRWRPQFRTMRRCSRMIAW